MTASSLVRVQNLWLTQLPTDARARASAAIYNCCEGRSGGLSRIRIELVLRYHDASAASAACDDLRRRGGSRLEVVDKRLLGRGWVNVYTACRSKHEVVLLRWQRWCCHVLS